MPTTCDLIINATRFDFPLLEITAPNMLRASEFAFGQKTLVVDIGARHGAYRNDRAAEGIDLSDQVRALFDRIVFIQPGDEKKDDVLSSFFSGRSGRRLDHRGGPIYPYLKPMLSSNADYICHLDCDILFFFRPGFSWIEKGVSVLEAFPDILAVAPHSGPPCDIARFAAAQPGRVEEREGLRLVDRLSTRKFLISSRWLRSLTPVTPQYVRSKRRRLAAWAAGRSALLPLEIHLTNIMRSSDGWRADLPASDCWSFHCPERTDRFMQILPDILRKVESDAFPNEQAGAYDLLLEPWERLLQTES